LSFCTKSDILRQISDKGPALRRLVALHLLFIGFWVTVLPNNSWGVTPIWIEQGEYRLGDSPQTPDERRLTGITDGFEYGEKDSEAGLTRVMKAKAVARAKLAADFPEPEGLLLGFVGRAVEKKFGLLAKTLDGKSVLEHILDIPRINVATVATGLPEYESFIRRLAFRPNCSATLAFDHDKAKQISLGSEVFLVSSLFEPCGITQMESMSSATPPLVRWAGGLVDTVKPLYTKGRDWFWIRWSDAGGNPAEPDRRYQGFKGSIRSTRGPTPGNTRKRFQAAVFVERCGRRVYQSCVLAFSGEK
jgi:glycogen synthase